MASVFEKSVKKEEDLGPDVEELYSQIGKLKVENDFLKKLQVTGDMKSRCRLIDPNSSSLSILQQCGLVSISRSNLYYQPKEEKSENLEIMRIMDQHLIQHSTEGVVFHGIPEFGWIESTY